jgi:thiol-disulfide isomerase/thioredoxin
VTGESLNLQGQATLITFLATTSPRSRENMPYLNAFADKYGSKGLKVVAVTSEDAAAVTAFLSRTRINFPIISSKTLANTFAVQLIPQALLIDRSGKVIWEGIPKNLPEAAIADALGGGVATR